MSEGTGPQDGTAAGAHGAAGVAVVLAQRVAAYGIARREDAVLLVRSSDHSDFPGSWSLPGGGVDHGEHPLDTVVREFHEETGLVVRVAGRPELLSDVLEVRDGAVQQHSVRVVVEVEVVGGELTDEPDGTTDVARWVPTAEASALVLMGFTRAALGLPPGRTVG